MLKPSKIEVKSFSDSCYEITFEQFAFGDPKEISIKILHAQTELLKHVVKFKISLLNIYFNFLYKSYKIEVKSTFFQTFYSYRRYNEFNALYKAVSFYFVYFLVLKHILVQN